MTRILVSGIRASGRHGANPGERDRPQEFVIDLQVDVEPTSDALEDTADYRAIVGAAIAAVEGSSVVLLETLADAVAREVRSLDGVRGVSAVVHKPRAARSLEVEDVAAEARAD